MKRRSSLLLALLVAAATSGCVFDDDSKDTTDTTETRLPALGAVYVGDEAYNAVGCGYDMFGNYADPTQIKGRVIEAYRLPDEYTKRTVINHSVFTTEDGSSITEYQSDLAVGLDISGSYYGFSGQVKTNFSSEYYSYSNTSFATVMAKINKYQLVISPNYARAELLRPYISNQAAKDLNDSTLTPQRLFTLYGTHVITGAMMGARLDFSVTMRTENITTGSTLSGCAEAEYSSLFSKVSTTAKFKSDEERTNYESNRLLKVVAIGGKSELAHDIITKSDYDNWLNSISGNEVFCDFTENGIIPIWEFCDEQTRRDELMAAYQTWARDRQIEIKGSFTVPKQCLLDLQVKAEDLGGSYDHNGMTYYKIDRDLNEDAGGAFIYIYAAFGLDNSTNPKPITKLAITYDKDYGIVDRTPAGYTRIDCDLNQDAGGDFIYLCYSRATDAEPIRRLEIWNSTEKVYALSHGATRTGAFYEVPGFDWNHNKVSSVDLNRNAGGDYLYLLYSHTNNQ